MARVTPEMVSERTQGTFGPGLLKSTLVVTLVLYSVLLLTLCVPPLLVAADFLFGFCTIHLWIYTGVPITVIVFVLGWIAGRKILQKKRHRLQLAAQLSAIAFIAVEICLVVVSFCIGARASWTAGYWLHMKLWLDTDELRQWAQTIDVPEDTASLTMFGMSIPREQWPSSLRRMNKHAGVYVCREPLRIALERGSPLTGHWGVYITAKGQDWAGEGRDRWIKKLEDGAWVWFTPD